MSIENLNTSDKQSEKKEEQIESIEKFPIWKTIKLGTFKTPEEIKLALETTKHDISFEANEILNSTLFQVTLAKEESEIDLVLVSVGDLGFKDGAKYIDIYKEAFKHGLKFCPLEVGPQLILQLNQPEKRMLVAADDLFLFNITTFSNNQWLDGGKGEMSDYWTGSDHFVFCR